MADVLVVDDDEEICSAFEQFLRELGHRPLVASNARDALAAVAESHPELVILDVRMPGMDGLEALRAIRQLDPKAYVVIMTAYGTSQTSIEAVQLGAFDYLTKPLDLDVVRAVIEKALEARALSLEAPGEGPEEWKSYALVNLVGSSPRMQDAYKRIGVLTTNDVPVLLVGEPGVGKELVARTIHFNSARREEPFRVLDCAALPESVLERELFSGREAAPAPAEAAGSLLLQNVEALTPALQARLLALLERGGAGRPRARVDLRILAATTRSLADEVRVGRFHGELADRLGVIRIELPPLRERKEDMQELVEFFVERCSAELGKSVRGVDERVMRRFFEHPWPRNVAELRNVIERGCVLARGEVITLADLGDSLRDTALPSRSEAEASLREAVRRALHQRLGDPSRATSASPFHDLVGQAEAALIEEALRLTSGNQVKAASLLDLNRATLRKKIQLYDLEG